jgi:hypothetical protein
MTLEGCCLPGQHGRAHGVLDLPLQIVSHEVPSPLFTIGFYTLVVQLSQLISPMLLHSQCIRKPTTTPNTKSWMWDEMVKKAWMVNACRHFMCTLKCFFTLLACTISIPMIQLHLFLVLSSHSPSLNQWEKTQRFCDRVNNGKRLNVLGVYNFQCENVQKC